MTEPFEDTAGARLRSVGELIRSAELPPPLAVWCIDVPLLVQLPAGTPVTALVAWAEVLGAPWLRIRARPGEERSAHPLELITEDGVLPGWEVHGHGTAEAALPVSRDAWVTIRAAVEEDRPRVPTLRRLARIGLLDSLH